MTLCTPSFLDSQAKLSLALCQKVPGGLPRRTKGQCVERRGREDTFGRLTQEVAERRE